MPSPAKAVSYGELAAQRSMAVYSYSEAVSYLQQAVQVQEIFDPADKARRCDLLLALGDALPTSRRALCRELKASSRLEGQDVLCSLGSWRLDTGASPDASTCLLPRRRLGHRWSRRERFPVPTARTLGGLHRGPC